ncbi:MAG: hypothetical protein AAFV25_15910, partial [Bacteroidota bacterium]
MAERFIVILVLFFVQASFAQQVEEQTDSLLNVLETLEEDSTKAEIYLSLTELNLYSHPLKTIQFCRQRIALCEQMQDHSCTYGSYIQLFNAQLYYGMQADSLLKTVQLMEKHTIEHRDEADLMNVYWVYALYYQNIKQTDNAIEAYIKALDKARKYDFGGEIEGALVGNIGGILLDQERYEEALDYIEKGLELITEDIGRGELFYDMGLIYTHNRNDKKALQSFEQSHFLYQRGKDTKGMAMALIAQAKYYDRKANFPKANQLYNRANDLIDNNDIGSLLPTIYVSLAKHYQQRQDHRTAVEYGEQSLAEIEKQKNYDALADAYSILHESYAKLGDHQRAYEIRGREMAYRDSVNSAELLTNVEALRTAFEVEQKETENQLLKAQAASNQKTIQSRNITAIALFLGLLLMLTWALTVFRISRQKQKYNEQLEMTVQERTAALKKANKNLVQANYELQTFNHIASHDIKEPMRNIGGYIGLIYRLLPSDVRVDMKGHFDTIRKSTYQLYTVVEDFSRYRQLSQDEEIVTKPVDLDSIIDSLDLALSDYKKDKNAKIINKGLIRIDTNASMMYIVLKKIIENGLKFNRSQIPIVSLSAQSNGEFAEIFIEDNGIGIAPAYQEQVFDNGQADARALKVFSLVKPLEHVKNLLLIGRGDPNAIVLNENFGKL